MSDFEIVTTSAGAVSIRNKVVNEIMHNPVGPWKEANDLYIDQSRLRERLMNGVDGDLVLFDVGLGAASNALAAIHAAMSLPREGRRRLRVVSFENNLELARFALGHASAFDHMRGFEEPLGQLLSEFHWESSCGGVVWDLREGDFLVRVEGEDHVPEVVFYDPYSPKVNQEMWTLSCFKKLWRHCAESPFGTSFYTYSVATPVRSALLLAGFYVGHGIATGLKHETTEFSTRLESLREPIGKSWYGRWVRSLNKWPYDTKEEEATTLRRDLHLHSQVGPWEPFGMELLKAAFPGRDIETISGCDNRTGILS